MGYRSWTDTDLETAVKSSKTKSEVLKKLGLKSRNSGNFQSVDYHIRRLNLNISHFSESIIGHPIGPRRDLKEVLVKNNDNYVSTHHLKIRLIKIGFLKEKCSICGITEWYGRKLSLHLDHIDGDRQNCEMNNLRLLCPNCHSLTPTYSKQKRKEKEQNKCNQCKKIISSRAKLCLPCNSISKRGKNLKINWPSHQSLLRMVENLGYRGVGVKLGVSDRAVSKRIKKHNNSYFVASVGNDPTSSGLQPDAFT